MRRRERQSGFALLLVFALAASVALMIYLELPRVAFEHQRNKEGLLVERGEQYMRAVQLYVRKNKKYPQTLEDLESSQNLRFLRKRYKDPMTGSEEWRLIHIDATGTLTDSLVQKRDDPLKGGQKNAPSILESAVQGIGSSAELTGGPQTQSPALMKRASDRLTGFSANPPQSPGSEEDETSGDSRSGPPMPGQGNAALEPVPMPQAPVAPPNFGGVPNPAGPNPGQPGAPQAPPSGFGSTPGGFGSAPGGFGSTPPAPQQLPPGFGGNRQPVPGGPQAPNSALNMIDNIIRNPKPQAGMMQGAQPGGAQMGAGAGMGAGIVGVASKLEMEGIRVYNERTNYKEWEFIYDIRQEQKQAMAQMGAGQNQNQNQNQNQSQNQNQGNQSGFGGGFGGGGFGSGQPQQPQQPQRPGGFGKQ